MIFKMATLLILLCVSLSLSKEMKALDNPPVKTILLDGGDIVDCVDFYKQPAFDHPLLKDHKIQMPPQTYATRRIKELESARSSDQACPIGTVPIRRTTNEELAMARALNHTAISASNASSAHGTVIDSFFTMIYVYMQKLEQRRYHGASAVISVHSLNITRRDQYSTASMWIQNGPSDALNMISVGWMVKSDSIPRLYLYWTADGGHKTGCYNLFCQGFVQVHPKISLGQILKPVSSYGGPIYDVKIKVFQDRQTKNWILYYSQEDIIVGYLPKELFPHLQYGAQVIAWGGVAYKANDEISPPMGSSYMPDGQYNHAAYFKNLTYYAYNFIRRWPSYYNTGHQYDKSDCYGFQNVSDSEHTWRTRFLYGGPGGHCGNKIKM